MSYEDIVEAQRKRDVKDASRIRQCKDSASMQGQQVNSRSVELRMAEEEIKSLGLARCCSVLYFNQLVLIELYCFKCFDSCCNTLQLTFGTPCPFQGLAFRPGI
jgi:hypothetical protein